jgi:uncharacterized protein YjbI with pentapeptide repeats
VATPTSRTSGPLVGGLVVAVLGMIVWAARRRQPAPVEPSPPGGPSSASGEPANVTPNSQPPTPRTAARPGAQAIVVAAVTLGIAAAVTLTLRTAHADPWWLSLAITGGVALLASCVFVFPRLLEPSRTPQDLADVHGLTAKDRIQLADDRRRLQNDVRTVLVQAVVGGAFLVGVLFTWQQQQATNRDIAKQLDVTRQGQVGERFSRAVSQLGSNSIDVRLGGLYELEQLARQAPERRLVITEVVAAYIRQHARPPAVGIQPPPQDVAAAFTITGRRLVEAGDPPIDLRGVNLDRTALSGVALRNADLSGARFPSANLIRANLIDANLSSSNLTGATLSIADLKGANLSHADLRGADLNNADLRGAHLQATDLSHAQLADADLRGTHLLHTDLRRATLFGADLRGATLFGADLRGATLHGYASNPDQPTPADLHGAKADKFTRWPDRFDWRLAGVELTDY